MEENCVRFTSADQLNLNLSNALDETPILLTDQRGARQTVKLIDRHDLYWRFPLIRSGRFVSFGRFLLPHSSC